VIDRVVTVGLDTVKSSEKLHQILLKELLTLNEVEANLTPKILELTSALAHHINKDSVYVETLEALFEKY
jgi:hypothetical protein